MDNIEKRLQEAEQRAADQPISQVPIGKLTPAEILKAARVSIDEEIEADPVVLHLKDGDKQIQFGTLGNFSMITGKAKSRKSFTLCLAIAAAIDGSKYAGGPFTCQFPPNKKRVAIFDTEQGRYRVWKALKRVCKMAGIDKPPAVDYFDLRAFNTEQRVEAINHYLTEENPQQDVGLVVIDGCRDLVHDFNDPTEATELATHLMQWTANAGCHIITVLHQNKADTNARGHVGSELTNKAETVITVEIDKRDRNVSIVKPSETRAEPFSGFAFTIDSENLPEYLPDYEVEGKQRERQTKFNPFNHDPGVHQTLIKRVFAGGEIEGRPQLLSSIRLAWQSIDMQLGDNSTKDVCTYWTNQGWIKNKAGAGAKAVYIATNMEGKGTPGNLG